MGYERPSTDVEKEANPHLPPRPATAPSSRHYLKRINQRSRVKAKNTVIASWVDVGADVAAINAGKAIRTGDAFLVNGRRYQQEASGTLAPIDGVGLFPLDRVAYNALAVYNQFGETSVAEVILARMHGVTDQAKQQALYAYRAARQSRG